MRKEGEDGRTCVRNGGVGREACSERGGVSRHLHV